MTDGILIKHWDGFLPLKIKCFAWLFLHRKKLTYDALQTHGIMGLYRCFQWSFDVETVDHLFGDFVFFQTICGYIFFHFTTSTRHWDQPCLSDSIGLTIKKYSLSMDVVKASLWSVWRMNNPVLFQNKKLDPYITSLKAIGWLHSYGSMIPKVSDKRMDFPMID